MKTVLGQILKSLREEKGITQGGLAKILNVSRSSVANYETGVREPDIACIGDIADFFKVSVDYLLGRNPARYENPEDERLAQLQELLKNSEKEKIILDGMKLTDRMALLDFYHFLYSVERNKEDVL